MVRWALAATLAVAAPSGCRPADTADTPPGAGDDAEPADTRPGLYMPDVPAAQPGLLVTLSDGAYALDGPWEAAATVCSDPPLLQLLVSRPEFGMLVLLDLPAADSLTVSYPVVVAGTDSSETAPPFARLAAHLLDHGRAYAFQGVDGSVILSSVGPATVSGRFAVSFTEVQSDDPEMVAGSFADVPLSVQGDGACGILSPAGFLVGGDTLDAVDTVGPG